MGKYVPLGRERAHSWVRTEPPHALNDGRKQKTYVRNETRRSDQKRTKLRWLEAIALLLLLGRDLGKANDKAPSAS